LGAPEQVTETFLPTEKQSKGKKEKDRVGNETLQEKKKSSGVHQVTAEHGSHEAKAQLDWHLKLSGNAVCKTKKRIVNASSVEKKEMQSKPGKGKIWRNFRAMRHR